MSRVNKKGFTLIELMLAMGFVSVLLIAIAMTVMQIANIYNRGMTLKDVNQAGRSLSSEIQRSIVGNARFDLSTRYVSQSWGGRLCLGQYSYVWNYGVDISKSNSNAYSNSGNSIRFVKALDPGASYCTTPNKKVDYNSSTELMAVSEHDIAVHNFSISSSAAATDYKTGQQLYNVNFVVGTNDQNALKDDPLTGFKICKSPSESGSDLAYCAVGQFNVIARAGNKAE